MKSKKLIKELKTFDLKNLESVKSEEGGKLYLLLAKWQLVRYS
jgi:hypothetical protein